MFHFSDEDIEEVVDTIREFYKDTMKVEMAPWAKSYALDMRDVNSEITLQKMENTLVESTKIVDYKKLFEGNLGTQGTLGIDLVEGSGPTNILVVGEPGMGKSTFCKKLAWDWAQGLFKGPGVVFYISLKDVRPGDTIEKMIIKQISALQEFDITELKLRNILGSLGSKCLVTLDGLDEFSSSDKNLLDIMTSRGFGCCSILATSRPEIPTTVADFFSVTARIEGFSQDHAQSVCSRLLRDKNLIEPVLDLNTESDALYRCSILLAFLCLLVNVGEIGIKQKTIRAGEIYYRLVRYLYQKLSLHGGLYKFSRFVKFLKGIGKIAFEQLQQNSLAFLRTELAQDIVNDAINCGILVQYSFPGSSDIWLTFPHISIQEFLGAEYFILNSGKRMENVIGSLAQRAMLLNKPSFLHFCLYFFNLLAKGKLDLSMLSFPLKSYVFEELYKRTGNSEGKLLIQFRPFHFSLCPAHSNHTARQIGAGQLDKRVNSVFLSRSDEKFDCSISTPCPSRRLGLEDDCRLSIALARHLHVLANLYYNTPVTNIKYLELCGNISECMSEESELDSQFKDKEMKHHDRISWVSNIKLAYMSQCHANEQFQKVCENVPDDSHQNLKGLDDVENLRRSLDSIKKGSEQIQIILDKVGFSIKTLVDLMVKHTSDVTYKRPGSVVSGSEWIVINS